MCWRAPVRIVQARKTPVLPWGRLKRDGIFRSYKFTILNLRLIKKYPKAVDIALDISVEFM